MIRQIRPQSTVIISLGTDTTDLGHHECYRVWPAAAIRSADNHFTKALTKRAEDYVREGEHLKRNAESENPKKKAISKAMRPRVQRPLVRNSALDRLLPSNNPPQRHWRNG